MKSFVIFVFCVTTIFSSSFALGLEGLQVGMRAPLFELKDLRGKKVALSEQMDADVAVVVFWATWSDHSPAVLERLQQLYTRYKRVKLSILAVNVEKQEITTKDRAAMEKVRDRLGITFPILIDEGLKIFREYGVVAVPSTVVLDRDTVIRGEMAAYPIAIREELFELIEAMAGKREVAQYQERTGYRPIPKAVRYYNLARAMAGRGMSDVIDANLERSISADPNFVLPLLHLAKLYRERAETEESIEYQGSTTVTASFKAERERYLKEALLLLEKARKLAPQSAPVLTEIAMVFLSQGKREAAREQIVTAIKADSSYTPAHFFLASLLVREKKAKEGNEEFQKALRLNPLDFQGYYLMASAYEEARMEIEAIEAYKRVYGILYRERELFPYSYGR